MAEQEVIVLTEEKIRFIYEVLTKPYGVSSTMTLYIDESNETGTFTSIEIKIMNDGQKFRAFTLQYNCDDQCETVIFKYGYTDESYEDLVEMFTDCFESEEFKKRVHRANIGGNFDEDKNIIFKTYKSA